MRPILFLDLESAPTLPLRLALAVNNMLAVAFANGGVLRFLKTPL